MNRLALAAIIFSFGMGLSTIIPVVPLVVCTVWAIVVLCKPARKDRVATPTGIVYPPANPNEVPVVGTYERAVGAGQYNFPDATTHGGKYRLTR